MLKVALDPVSFNQHDTLIPLNPPSMAPRKRKQATKNSTSNSNSSTNHTARSHTNNNSQNAQDTHDSPDTHANGSGRMSHVEPESQCKTEEIKATITKLSKSLPKMPRSRSGTRLSAGTPPWATICTRPCS
ncbi:unnamed protein product [Mortierella alpina]